MIEGRIQYNQINKYNLHNESNTCLEEFQYITRLQFEGNEWMLLQESSEIFSQMRAVISKQKIRTAEKVKFKTSRKFARIKKTRRLIKHFEVSHRPVNTVQTDNLNTEGMLEIDI